VVRQVHEKETGAGYPDGLAGDDIDPLAKVIGLADTLESLTHSRARREALIAFDAIQLLMKDHSQEYDSRVFRAMVRQISLFPVGSRVRLNNGSIARVASINPDNFYRPKVEMVQDPSGKKMVGGSSVDLADSPFLYITGPFQGELPRKAKKGAA
jgi:HD-GYP domain-containing protein (c-di-GMP phosphodiesterase class II)